MSAAPAASSSCSPRSSAGTADELARALALVLAVAEDHVAALHGGDVARRALHEPTGVGRQVVHHLRAREAETFVVDDVHVAELAGLEGAPVAQPDEPGRVAGHGLHHEL